MANLCKFSICISGSIICNSIGLSKIFSLLP